MHKTKQDRQQEAIERMLARDNRTTIEQLHRIVQRDRDAKRGGKSERETIRLLRLRALEEAIL